MESRPEGTDNVYTTEDLLRNDGEEGKRLWVLIDGKVYDVTEYKHPGGKELLLDDIGTDRKDEFNAIGHSPEALNIMKGFLIGTLKKEEKASGSNKGDFNNGKEIIGENSSLTKVIVPVAFAIAILLVVYFLTK
jgi:cytochrome b involved in lipid metabolism